MLCKHEVSGSIPLSSTIIIQCFLIAAVCFGIPERWAPIRKQAGRSFETGWQVYTASGRAFSATNEKVWMFDNEIDWVMRICSASFVPVAERLLQGCGVR